MNLDDIEKELNKHEKNKKDTNKEGDKILQETKVLVSKIKAIKDELNAFKPLEHKVRHEYALSDEVSIKELKNAINSVNIPSVVKLEKTNNITFSNGTRKFLWWYFGLSTPIIAVLIYFTINGLVINQPIRNNSDNYLKGYYKGQKDGRVEIYNSLPNSSQNYLDKKFPKSSFWK